MREFADFARVPTGARIEPAIQAFPRDLRWAGARSLGALAAISRLGNGAGTGCKKLQL